MVDIADEHALREYLQCNTDIIREFKPKTLDITYFDGGVSGTVALVSDGQQEILVKQALGQLRVGNLWECGPERLFIEKKAFETYASIMSDNSLEVLSYDEKNNIMVRRGAPKSCSTWKSHLQRGLFDFRTSDMAVSTLLKLHNETANDEEIAEKFRDETYFIDLRRDPYICFVAAKYPSLSPMADEVIDYMAHRRVCLIHGDYSPKNILVDSDRIYIIDHEVAVYGNPCFDLAFLANHFLLKTIHYRQYGETYMEMLRYMLKIYLARLKCLGIHEAIDYSTKILTLLFIARVDGKSPVDYITEESEKNVVREVTFEIIRNGVYNFEALFDTLRSALATLESK
jgi:hypothetical protein